METMAELGVAAGGRVLAEDIAVRADQNVKNGIVPPPQNADDRQHPERFLTDNDRDELQSSPAEINSVTTAIKGFIKKNALANLTSLDVNDPVAVVITYPVQNNLCGGVDKTVDIKVALSYTYPFFMERLSTAATGQPGIKLEAESTYNLVICP